VTTPVIPGILCQEQGVEGLRDMKSYKTELDLNNKQRTACLRHAGAARWAYNWGLHRKIEEREAKHKVPSAIDLHKELVALKQGELAWMYSVSKCAPHEALRHLDKAYKDFFRRCKSKAKRKGFPRFKSKKNGVGSFTLNGAIHVGTNTVQLPRLGILRLKEHNYLPTNERVISATVSEKAGHWFVSVTTDAVPTRSTGTETLGVDVGTKTLATLSDGVTYKNPKALYKAEKKLRRLQQAVSRKVKGSQNRKKAVRRLAIQHYKVACLRKDSLHKMTDAITKRTAVLGVESLNVEGMKANHHLAKAVSDAAMSEVLRQLQYKMSWAKGIVIEADRWFPSSKKCSRCGVIKTDLTLKERVYICESCGLVIDRDWNAAINLREYAVSFTVSACGEISSDVVRHETSLNEAGTKHYG
jgi:putative transposase